MRHSEIFSPINFWCGILMAISYQNKLGDGKTLAHSYRKLQKWNAWLSHQPLGQYLLSVEKKYLSILLKNHFGKHALLVGVPEQRFLFEATNVPFQILTGPLLDHHHTDPIKYIEADLHELPILTGSIDLVLLPHTFEFIDNGRQLLREICRIVRPEGLVAICGFNPYSLWGMRKLIAANSLSPKHIKKWLKLADFQIEKQTYHLYLPPLTNIDTIKKLEWLEYIGNLCFPFLGGIYIVLARAKVVPLTPIRLKWKQQLSGIRISPTISGPLIR